MSDIKPSRKSRMRKPPRLGSAKHPPEEERWLHVIQDESRKIKDEGRYAGDFHLGVALGFNLGLSGKPSKRKAGRRRDVLSNLNMRRLKAFDEFVREGSLPPDVGFEQFRKKVPVQQRESLKKMLQRQGRLPKATSTKATHLQKSKKKRSTRAGQK